jgi:hypothetical protein
VQGTPGDTEPARCAAQRATMMAVTGSCPGRPGLRNHRYADFSIPPPRQPKHLKRLFKVRTDTSKRPRAARASGYSQRCAPPRRATLPPPRLRSSTLRASRRRPHFHWLRRASPPARCWVALDLLLRTLAGDARSSHALIACHHPAVVRLRQRRLGRLDPQHWRVWVARMRSFRAELRRRD